MDEAHHDDHGTKALQDQPLLPGNQPRVRQAVGPASKVNRSHYLDEPHNTNADVASTQFETRTDFPEESSEIQNGLDLHNSTSRQLVYMLTPCCSDLPFEILLQKYYALYGPWIKHEPGEFFCAWCFSEREGWDGLLLPYYPWPE
jgi:hypothetical protein